MIIDIRGTNGSGKSTIMRKLMDLSNPSVEHINEQGKHLGYYLKRWDAALLGNYKQDCGGCDGIHPASAIRDRVRKFVSDGFRNVLLEGVMVSYSFTPYAEIADEVGKQNYVFCFLDTPIELCIERVVARRLGKGNTKPFDPNRHLKGKYQNVYNFRRKAELGGYRFVILNYKNPIPRVLGLLREGMRK